MFVVNVVVEVPADVSKYVDVDAMQNISNRMGGLRLKFKHKKPSVKFTISWMSFKMETDYSMEVEIETEHSQ